MTPKIVTLNPIITDPKYYGLSSGDVRVAEIADKIAEVMEHSGVFEDRRLILLFKFAAENLDFTKLETAIECMYNYADAHNIWVGEAKDMPTN